MPASTCPPTKKPSEKFMYDAVTPPSGPSTKTPRQTRRAWYFQVPTAGSQDQRGAEGAIAFMGATVQEIDHVDRRTGGPIVYLVTKGTHGDNMSE